MSNVETLLKTITGEKQKWMTTKSVVGDPITLQDTTLIPLISIGMGFGAGDYMNPGSISTFAIK